MGQLAGQAADGLVMMFIFKKVTVCLVFVAALSFLSPSSAAEQGSIPQYAGEFFDIKVPMGNYYFIKGTFLVFGRSGAPVSKDPKELENQIWEELLLSYEAFRRGVTVNQNELEDRITKVLEDNKADFDWKKDKAAYGRWLKEKINEPVELFQNQMRHILQMENLRQRVSDSIQPKVSEQEAHQQFLNEYSSLGLELAEFEKKDHADKFFKTVKANPLLWDKEKEKRPKSFKQPGFVSVIFLMDFWKIPRGAAFKMLALKKGEFYESSPIYNGYAVFKVLAAKKADESVYAKSKPAFYEKVKAIKKYRAVDDWVKVLKQQAKIKIYPQKGGG